MLEFNFNTDSGLVVATMDPGEVGPEGYPFWSIKWVGKNQSAKIKPRTKSEPSGPVELRETCRSSDLLGLVDEYYGSATQV
jgi:hypothetical protein